MTSVMIIVVVFVMILEMSFVMVFTVGFASMIAGTVASVPVPRLISRHIFFIVPSVAYKIDRPSAGIILMAMLFPLLFVAGRHMNIDRRRGRHTYRHGSDQNRLGINDFRPGKISNIDLAVKTGLANAD